MKERNNVSPRLFRVFMLMVLSAFFAGVGMTDYISAAQADDALPSVALVTGTNVRVRTAPSLSSKEIMQVSGGFVFVYGDSVESDGHNWYKVKITEANGKILKNPAWGWMSDQFLTDDFSGIVKGEDESVLMLIKGSNVRIRTAPSLNAKEIVQMTGGFVFVHNYTSPVSADGQGWCSVTITELKGKKLKKQIHGWISEKFLDARYYPN